MKNTEVADVTTYVLTCETDIVGLSSKFLGSQFVCYLYALIKEA